jgi:hypothetical protein
MAAADERSPLVSQPQQGSSGKNSSKKGKNELSSAQIVARAKLSLAGLRSAVKELHESQRGIGGPVDGPTLRRELRDSRERCASLARESLDAVRAAKGMVEGAELMKQFQGEFARCREVSTGSIERERSIPPSRRGASMRGDSHTLVSGSAAGDHVDPQRLQAALEQERAQEEDSRGRASTSETVKGAKGPDLDVFQTEDRRSVEAGILAEVCRVVSCGGRHESASPVSIPHSFMTNRLTSRCMLGCRETGT